MGTEAALNLRSSSVYSSCLQGIHFKYLKIPTYSLLSHVYHLTVPLFLRHYPNYPKIKFYRV